MLNGINVDDTPWKDHLVMIVAKANRMLGFLKRNCAGIVGSMVLLRLYCSLMRIFVFALSYGPLSQVPVI